MNKYVAIAAVVLASLAFYFVYDYGYTKGYDSYKAICEANMQAIQSKAEQQNQIISESEQKLAESAKAYEQLRQELEAKKEQQWGSTKEVFSKEFSARLQSLLH